MKTNNIEKWFNDPRLFTYLGRTAAIRLSVLARHLTGAPSSLAEIARQHRVSKAALTEHARRCREAFGPSKAQVDSPPITK